MSAAALSPTPSHARAAPEGPPIASLMERMHQKQSLLARYSLEQAFDMFCKTSHMSPSTSLQDMKIRGFFEAISEHGEIVHLLHRGGQPAEFPAPAVHGEAFTQSICGTTRHVFLAQLKDALVFGRSGAVICGEDILFDIEPAERAAVSLEMQFDPAIFRCSGDIAKVIMPPRADICLDEAWSLLGVNTISFGHWMIEAMPQFLGARNHARLKGVPILIDAGMPRQHREALELFGQNRFTIIPVHAHMSVFVKRLLVTSNWHFTPNLLKSDRGVDGSYFVYPRREYAKLWQDAAQEVDVLLGTRNCGERWFLARSSDRHRRIVNDGELRRFLVGKGFRSVEPEDLSFVEQVALIRRSSLIVVQSGSAVQILMLCNAGASIIYLTHPSLPFISLLNEGLTELGAKFTIVTGPFKRETFPYRDQSDYAMPIDTLNSIMADDGKLN